MEGLLYVLTLSYCSRLNKEQVVMNERENLACVRFVTKTNPWGRREDSVTHR